MGAVDSIVDVCGAAVVLELLGWPRVLCAPPELGQGFVATAHGRLPVPPPAVLEILNGIPVRPGGPPGRGGHAHRRGAAGRAAPRSDPAAFPALAPERIGYGVGTRALARPAQRAPPDAGRAGAGAAAAAASCWVLEATSTTARASSWPAPSRRRWTPARSTPGPRRSP